MAMIPLSPLQSNTPTGVGIDSQKKTSQSNAQPMDAATFSSAAMLLNNGLPIDGNAAKIAELKSRIADGAYKPNTQAIAEILLQEAWLSKADK
jgi:flagellar biosynthesis anti-sigma factor FlgM